MLNKRELAGSICNAADLSGYTGKRWAIMANAVSLYVDLEEAIRQDLAGFGYKALPVRLQGSNEVCRLEGEAVIVVIERVLEKDGVGYDITVFCREQEMRPIIWNAIQPLVADYATKDLALLKSFLKTTSEEPLTLGKEEVAGDGRHGQEANQRRERNHLDES